ncbi:unnamed protein product [Agarophyton chilense]
MPSPAMPPPTMLASAMPNHSTHADPPSSSTPALLSSASPSNPSVNPDAPPSTTEYYAGAKTRPNDDILKNLALHPIPGCMYGPPPGALASAYVGSYSMYGIIGEGAFGKVRMAVHKPTGMRVAIKIMEKNEIRAHELAHQVRREIYIMRSLKHRHIVRMFEVLTSDKRLYIVMELVNGGELFDRISKGRLDESTARHFFQQLVDGVHFCHKKGIVHRDLKPENLLVDEKGNIKITDFGFSSMKGMDVQTGLLHTQCGTPDYCAPEIIDIAQEGYTGSKVDAWSCGIILFALLCGRLPFLDQDVEKLYDQILACKVKYPSHLSRNARDLLENLLIRDPKKRFALPNVKRHPWFLVDYDGDDARLLKKTPFFRKRKDASRSESLLTSTTAANPPGAPPFASNTVPASRSLRKSTGSEGKDTSASRLRNEPLTNNERKRTQGSPMQLVDAGNPRNIYSQSRPPSGTTRYRDEQPYPPLSPSPLSALHEQARAPTPPSPEVYTRVHDRPVIPARRQTAATASAAFKAAAAAAALYAPDGTPKSPNQLPAKPYNPQSPSRRSPASRSLTPIVPTDGTSSSQQHPIPGPMMLNRIPNVGYQHVEVPPRGMDEGSISEEDSVEDYEEKPALPLEMPLDPRQALYGKSSDRHYLQSLPQHIAARQRSELVSTTRQSPIPAYANPLENGSSSLSALPRSRNRYGREAFNQSGVNDPRSLRASRTPDVPSSPSLVYSPSTMSGPSSYDRFRSASPGFGNTRPGGLNEGMPSSPDALRGGLGGGSAAWYSTGRSTPNGYQPMREDSNSLNAKALQAELLLRHHWGMLTKWRGSSEPVSRELAIDLRKDMLLTVEELKQITNLEDRANLFSSFLHMFEQLALGEALPSNAEGRRLHGEEGEVHANVGDNRIGNIRLAATDISSEEEPMSWSPVVVEASGPRSSDIARRREMSDLLNQWIHRTDFYTSGGTDHLEAEEQNIGYDLRDLQRVMREQHSGREESNLADDLLRMMSNAEDTPGSCVPTYGPGSTPSSSSMASTAHTPRHGDPRHGEQYNWRHGNGASPNWNGQHSARNGTGAIRNTSNNSSLPPEYVPGRFRESSATGSRRGRSNNENVIPGSSAIASEGLRKNIVMDSNNAPHESNGGGRSSIDYRKRKTKMAGSMGMHDVEYYTSDRKNGMAHKLLGVLHNMKAKNHRLGEHHAQFKSPFPTDAIIRILATVLKNMGAEVKVNIDTRKKIKCEMSMGGWNLHAGIEVNESEDGLRTVAFRRSKADRGKTDTESFHRFYQEVRSNFVREAEIQYPSSRLQTSGASRRKRGKMVDRERNAQVAEPISNGKGMG